MLKQSPRLFQTIHLEKSYLHNDSRTAKKLLASNIFLKEREQANKIDLSPTFAFGITLERRLVDLSSSTCSVNPVPNNDHKP